jgi:hypothetical protein
LAGTSARGLGRYSEGVQNGGRVMSRVRPRRAGGRGAAPVVAGALPTALLAGCGSTVAAASRPTGQQLRRALAAWSKFPVSVSPRPLVLAGPDITGPLPGFPSGATKLAYLQGAITFPANMPHGRASAGGFRVITARQAAALFRPGAVKGPPPGTRLRVTTVRLGAGMFVTDRGVRRLPAWRFGFTAIRGPAAVLAVAPTQLFTPPVRPGGRPPLVDWAYLGTGGRALTVRFTGAPVTERDPRLAQRAALSAPLCQEAAVLAVGFGLFEEAVVESGTGVEDLDADEAVVFPVQRDEPAGAGRRGAWRVVRPGASGSLVRWMQAASAAGS